MLQTIGLFQIVMKRPQLNIIFCMSLPTSNLPYLSCLFKVLFVLSLQPFSFRGGRGGAFSI